MCGQVTLTCPCAIAAPSPALSAAAHASPHAQEQLDRLRKSPRALQDELAAVRTQIATLKFELGLDADPDVRGAYTTFWDGRREQLGDLLPAARAQTVPAGVESDDY